ncbi:hypothetical protein OROMI_033522 [Orobanche minor]
MPEHQIMSNEIGEEEKDIDNINVDANTEAKETEYEVAGRKKKRKTAKKEKRKKKRKVMAEMARREEEARLDDPEEQLRLQAEEEQEKARAEKDRREFEERERKILEEWERRRAEDQREEEERRRRAQEEVYRIKQKHIGYANESDEDGWEYVQEGSPEIIWQENEIIVKKKKIRVKKKDADHQNTKEDPNRPTSNPLPPQSLVFSDYNTSVLSAQQLLENVAQETPNFGTEQDKAHCPFHLKTGACRFGPYCSRIHFYPDKSCTLLIKNMYNGPGLAWEQDEGLEYYTDEEVEHAYEEFYEDVHTEFLKSGEIVNFKVCRNGLPHLRGNVYVHFKSLDSAVLAYQSVNGRYFAGKQIQCKFVGVTRWKVAICGEFMKSKLQTCSRGMACNFIHCFRNPGGDYEWADWDKPPPKYWLEKMVALFGYPDESEFEKRIARGSPTLFRKSSRQSTYDVGRCRSHRSQSRETGYSRSSRNYSEDEPRSSECRRHHTVASGRKRTEVFHDKQYDDTPNSRKKLRSKNGKLESHNWMSIHADYSDENMHHNRDTDKYRCRHSSRSTRHRDKVSTSPDDDDGERENAPIYVEKFPESDCSEEFEDNNSDRKRGHRLKHSSSRYDKGRRHGELEHDSINSKNHNLSDSRSRSREDTNKIECGGSERELRDRHKKSKRKRDADESDISESRIESRKVKRSLATDYDEGADDRGRWESDIHTSD